MRTLPTPTTEEVRTAIRRVVDPCSIATGAPIDLVEMGLVRGIEIEAGVARVTICFTSPLCWQATNIRQALERTVGEVPGVEDVVVDVDFDAEWMPDMIDPAAQRRLRRLRPLDAVRRGKSVD